MSNGKQILSVVGIGIVIFSAFAFGGDVAGERNLNSNPTTSSTLSATTSATTAVGINEVINAAWLRTHSLLRGNVDGTGIEVSAAIYRDAMPGPGKTGAGPMVVTLTLVPAKDAGKLVVDRVYLLSGDLTWEGGAEVGDGCYSVMNGPVWNVPSVDLVVKCRDGKGNVYYLRQVGVEVVMAM